MSNIKKYNTKKVEYQKKAQIKTAGQEKADVENPVNKNLIWEKKLNIKGMDKIKQY